MKKSEIKKMFDRYNREFFNGELPDIRLILKKIPTWDSYAYYKPSWTHPVTREMEVSKCSITIYPNAFGPGFCEILFHEMVHYYLHFKRLPFGHTQVFRSYMRKFLGKSTRYLTTLSGLNVQR